MLTRKDQLYEGLERASILYGSEWFNFIPDFFCTPLGIEARHSIRQKFEEPNFGLDTKFIVKPADGSLGRGIYFLDHDNLNETIDTDRKLVVSHYIDRPYLINGLKWDLRVYVLVTSFYPLIAYVYSDGLARFAVHKYNEKQQDGVDMNKHLTNYSLNKTAAEFVRNTDCTVENMGHKWTLSALLRELERHGEDVGLLMVRIEDIVIKSLLSVQSSVAAMCRKLNVHPKCCFELFGFDILVDEHLKPWLLEINLSPSLTCDSPLDSLLKTHLFCDSLNIAQIPLVSETNMLNECFSNSADFDQILSKDNDKDSDQCSTTSASAPSVSSAFSYSNAENFSNCPPASPVKNNGLKRKGNGISYSQCFGKMRRLDRIKKINYSAERVTPQYLDRLKCYFDKLKSEEQRLGYFNRIFPRRWTWHLYRTILEDCGQEKWDEALHNRMNGENNAKSDAELTLKDIELLHEQLMDAQTFKRRGQLAPIVCDVLLAEAFEGAECYRRRRYSGDVTPFPSSLPRIRQSARRRTKSQMVEEEARRIRTELRRKATLPEGREREGQSERNDANSVQGTGCQAVAKPLSEVNLNVGQQERLSKMDEEKTKPQGNRMASHS